MRKKTSILRYKQMPGKTAQGSQPCALSKTKKAPFACLQIYSRDPQTPKCPPEQSNSSASG